MPTLQANSVDHLIDAYGLPRGYQRVSWDAVVQGQTVWLFGTHLGVPVAYGPHRVDSVQGRRLLNRKGQRFLHYPESLLVPG